MTSQMSVNNALVAGLLGLVLIIAKTMWDDNHGPRFGG